jgi:ABC-2 type transport system ATP-binding protein
VVSSHLLGEVERICDHLVALERGGLLRADTMTSFTRVSQVLAVEVDEGVPELAAELTRRGLASRPDERALLVRLEGDATYDVIRDVIADLGLPLNRLEQRRRRVEELFRDDQAASDDRAPGGAA